MYDEMFGSFILLLGSPGQQSGQESELSVLSGLGVVFRFFASSPWGGFGWLMFEEVLGAFMALIFSL